MTVVFIKDIFLPTITKTNGSDCAGISLKANKKASRKGSLNYMIDKSLAIHGG
jgi:hypothetical protein